MSLVNVCAARIEFQAAQRDLDTERELDADIDVAGDLDEFGELDGLLGGVLEVVDGEDLEAGFVDLVKSR